MPGENELHLLVDPIDSAIDPEDVQSNDRPLATRSVVAIRPQSYGSVLASSKARGGMHVGAAAGLGIDVAGWLVGGPNLGIRMRLSTGPPHARLCVLSI